MMSTTSKGPGGGHGGKRDGAGRPQTTGSSWEARHVRVPIERPLHRTWVELRENGGF